MRRTLTKPLNPRLLSSETSCHGYRSEEPATLMTQVGHCGQRVSPTASSKLGFSASAKRPVLDDHAHPMAEARGTECQWKRPELQRLIRRNR